MKNVLDLGKDKTYPKEAELMGKLTELIDLYAGELSLVSVIGILELKKSALLHG
jgi:hypothetical protein